MKTLTLKLTGSACAGVAAILAVQEARGSGSSRSAGAGAVERNQQQGRTIEFRQEVLRKPAKAANREARPQRMGIMQVGGQVRLRGEITVMAGMTLEEVLTAAGSATEFGAPKRATLHRDGERITVDLTTQQGKAMKAEAYDVLEIPQKTWIGR